MYYEQINTPMILSCISTDAKKLMYLLDCGAVEKDDEGKYVIVDSELISDEKVTGLLEKFNEWS